MTSSSPGHRTDPNIGHLVLGKGRLLRGQHCDSRGLANSAYPLVN